MSPAEEAAEEAIEEGCRGGEGGHTPNSVFAGVEAIQTNN